MTGKERPRIVTSLGECTTSADEALEGQLLGGDWTRLCWVGGRKRQGISEPACAKKESSPPGWRRFKSH